MTRTHERASLPAGTIGTDARARRGVLGLLALVAVVGGVTAIVAPAVWPGVLALAAAVAFTVAAAWHLGRDRGVPPAVSPAEDVEGTAPTDLIAAVSHDLRTPLATIGAYVELLETGEGGELSGEQRKLLDIVEENVHRAYAIADDLVDLRTGDGTGGRTEPVRMAALLARVVRATEPHARDRGVGLALDLTPAAAGAVVSGRPAQLDRILANLLSNSLKFTGAGGRIDVRADVVGGELVIAVRDTGTGIAEDEQQRIFERHYRAGAARDGRVPGSGLGLAIVRELTAQHGGRVDVRSRPGQGATFTLRLPVVGTDAGTDVGTEPRTDVGTDAGTGPRTDAGTSAA